MKIYTDNTNHEDVTVSEGNKWYTYVLPKDKSLCKIESGTYNYEWSNGIVTKAVVKANINYNYDKNNNRRNGIVPWEITEASFKGSNTSNVTDMRNMFNGCNSLTSLTLSNFNTSNVTNMSYMFYGCNSLTSLDVSNFNTSNVTNMSNMFYGCSGLTSLDLSGWDTSNVSYISDMFNGCSNLTSIRMKGCNQTTIDKIKALKPSTATIVTE